MRNRPSDPNSLSHINVLFSACNEVSARVQDCLIPVGGSMLSDKITLFLKADVGAFAEFYDEVGDLVQSKSFEPIERWLAQHQADIPAALFAHLHVFNMSLAGKYPFPGVNRAMRDDRYQPGSAPLLSALFDEQCHMCSEIATLAVGYLQQAGVSASYVNGHVLWNKDHEFSDAHSFVLVRDSGARSYIFDPTNPSSLK